MIRIAIIDDHVVVRAGLKYLIDADKDLEFAGEFGGGDGAAEFVSTVNPDVTLLDVRMPDKTGIEVLKEIRANNSNAKVVMLTTSDVEEDIYRSIEEGALGYVMKDSSIETIREAIQSAVNGEVFMSNEVRKIYETRKCAKGLSSREVEVLKAAQKGLGNREIGSELGISENSVKMHLKRAFFKLGASDRAEAVSLASKRGFLV